MRNPFQRVARPTDSALGAPPPMPPPERMHRWIQIGGDMSPESHGGCIARADDSGIDVVRIENLRDHVGDREASETRAGGQFFSDSWWFDWDDLDMEEDPETWRRLCDEFGFAFPDECEDQMDAFFRAEARTQRERAGASEQGSSRDVLPARATEIEWWGGETTADGFDDEDGWFAGETIRRPRADRQTEQTDRLPPSAQDRWSDWWDALPLKFPWPREAEHRLKQAAG